MGSTPMEAANGPPRGRIARISLFPASNTSTCLRLPMQKTDRCVGTSLRDAEGEGERGQLLRRGDHGQVLGRGLELFGGLAGNLGKLAHPVGAEREQDVGQAGNVVPERISVPLDENTVAQECLDA